jgi:hypothetical protein
MSIAFSFLLSPFILLFLCLRDLEFSSEMGTELELDNTERRFRPALGGMHEAHFNTSIGNALHRRGVDKLPNLE